MTNKELEAENRRLRMVVRNLKIEIGRLRNDPGMVGDVSDPESLLRQCRVAGSVR